MKATISVCNNFRLQKAPSIFISSMNQMIVINLPEQAQRFLSENNIKMNSNSNILFTGSSTDYFLGLPGYMLTSINRGSHTGNKIFMNEELFKLLKEFKFLFGPKFLYLGLVGLNDTYKAITSCGINSLPTMGPFANPSSFVDFFYSYTGNPGELPVDLQKILNNPETVLTNKSQFFNQDFITEHNVKVIQEKDYELVMIAIRDEEGKRVSYCYLVIFFTNVPKLDKDKLAKYNIKGVKVKELLKSGMVTVEGDKTVMLEDVTMEKESPACLILDVPTMGHLGSFLSNKFLHNILSGKNNFKINYLFHLTQSQIVQSERFSQFLGLNYVSELKNVFLNSDFDLEFNGPSNLRSKVYFDSMSNKFPNFYPMLEQTKTENINNWNNPNFISHTSFNTYDVINQKSQELTNAKEAKMELDVIRSLFEQPKSPAYLKHQDRIQTQVGFTNFPFLITLGTGSMLPSSFRTVSSILYAISDSFYALMDCGEGTLFQITEQFGKCSDEAILKIQMVMITHLHGDHFFGLLEFMRYRTELVVSKQLKDHPRLIMMVPKNCLSLLMVFIKYSELYEHVIVVTNQEMTEHYLPREEVERLEKLVRTEEKKHGERAFNYKNLTYLKSVQAYGKKYKGSKDRVLEILKANNIQRVLPVPVFHCPESEHDRV